jgi:hypothetical protein
MLDRSFATVVAHRYNANRVFPSRGYPAFTNVLFSLIVRHEKGKRRAGDGAKSTHPLATDLGLGFVKVWPGYGQGRAGLGAG